MGGRKPPAASPGAGRPSGSRRFEVDEATAKARSDEAKAAELYRAARAAERAGMTDLARRLFKRLREEHPGSALAEKAKARL